MELNTETHTLTCGLKTYFNLLHLLTPELAIKYFWTADIREYVIDDVEVHVYLDRDNMPQWFVVNAIPHDNHLPETTNRVITYLQNAVNVRVANLSIRYQHDVAPAGIIPPVSAFAELRKFVQMPVMKDAIVTARLSHYGPLTTSSTDDLAFGKRLQEVILA